MLPHGLHSKVTKLLEKSLPSHLNLIILQIIMCNLVSINNSIITTTNGIIVVGLIYKRSVDIGTENFSVALEPLISSLDPRIKTYIMGDFNINLLDHYLSPSVENFINQMMSKNVYQSLISPLK